MKRHIQRLIEWRLKLSKLSQVKGFTLIELLVASIMAGIIVAVLLAFVVEILQSDRREQAKSDMQMELQAALDFIADDLKQAVYIYDADGIERDSSQNPPGIRDQLPGVTAERVPVLVFWKRHYYNPNDEVGVGPDGRGAEPKEQVRKIVLGVANTENTPNGPQNVNEPIGEPRYVYALVAYYLRSNRGGQGLVRANTMQIERIEIRDGIRSDCQNAEPATCPLTPAPIKRVNDINYWVVPDRNFRRFDLTGVGTLRDRMNRWRNAGLGYDLGGVNQPQVILDFVDDTIYTPAHDDSDPKNSLIHVPIRPNNDLGGNVNNFFSDNPDCADPVIGVGRNPPNGDTNGDNKIDIATQRIPGRFDTSTTLSRADNASSFFVCVNSMQNVARVYIRANALARLSRNYADRRFATGRTNESSFLTTSSIRAFARSSITLP